MPKRNDIRASDSSILPGRHLFELAHAEVRYAKASRQPVRSARSLHAASCPAAILITRLARD